MRELPAFFVSLSRFHALTLSLWIEHIHLNQIAFNPNRKHAYYSHFGVELPQFNGNDNDNDNNDDENNIE